jgi:hypothetical protein
MLLMQQLVSERNKVQSGQLGPKFDHGAPSGEHSKRYELPTSQTQISADYIIGPGQGNQRARSNQRSVKRDGNFNSHNNLVRIFPVKKLAKAKDSG